MDAEFLAKAIETNRTFLIRTAAGDTYEVPHRDFLSFSARRTTVMISFERDGREQIAYVPLLTITSVEADQEQSGIH